MSATLEAPRVHRVPVKEVVHAATEAVSVRVSRGLDRLAERVPLHLENMTVDSQPGKAAEHRLFSADSLRHHRGRGLLSRAANAMDPGKWELTG